MAKLGSKNAVAAAKKKAGVSITMKELLKHDEEMDQLMDVPTLEKDLSKDKKLLAQKKMTMKDIEPAARPKSMAPTSMKGAMRAKDIKYGSRKNAKCC